MQKLRPLIVCALMLSALSACDPITKLRALVHGTAASDPNGAAAPEDDPNDTALGKTSLLVTVQPAQGISILIDGIKASDHSPFSTSLLVPGGHVVVVRGMGYLPIVLPITLKENEPTKVPVSLRPRPVAAPPEPEIPEPAGPLPESAGPTAAEKTDLSPDVPISIPPIDLHVVAQPSASMMLDGQRLESKAVHIRRSRGMLQVGLMSMPYGVTPGRVLEMNVPADDATWHKDGIPVRAGTLVRLSHGFTRLRRIAKDGTDQSVVLRRIN